MVADGTELALTEKEAVVAGSDDVVGGRQAIAAAADLAAADLAERLVAVWGKEGKALTTIKIAVEGTRDLANFVKFRRVIKKMQDVENIKTLEMKPDQAVIEVDYQGTADAFANSLMVNPFEDFRLDIYEVSGELLRGGNNSSVVFGPRRHILARGCVPSASRRRLYRTSASWTRSEA